MLRRARRPLALRCRLSEVATALPRLEESARLEGGSGEGVMEKGVAEREVCGVCCRRVLVRRQVGSPSLSSPVSSCAPLQGDPALPCSHMQAWGQGMRLLQRVWRGIALRSALQRALRRLCRIPGPVSRLVICASGSFGHGKNAVRQQSAVASHRTRPHPCPPPPPRVCKPDTDSEADAEVALSFARARLHDLGSNLHRSNALFYNALTHHGYAMRRCPEAENARARA